MKLNKPRNENYCAFVAKVNSITKLDGCDNIVHANVNNYHVIVSKDVKDGEIGIFFPVECKLSTEFLHHNNLNRDKTLNVDQNKSGYIELNGRIRCAKLRGYKSEGLFISLESVSWTGANISELSVGDCFDELNGKDICEKYTVIKKQNPESIKDKKGKKIKRINRLKEGQFKLHVDTAQLKNKCEAVKGDSLISITEKFHGTSAVFSNVIVKKKLSVIDKIAKFFGANIQEYEYDTIYSSRNVVKNGCFNPTNSDTFYGVDVWSYWCNKIKHKIPKGFSLYGEIVGYAENGREIQNGYDYGCKPNESEFYVYRITSTNEDGLITELNRQQIDEFCNFIGLKTTPIFYFGYAKDLYSLDGEFSPYNLVKSMEGDNSLAMNNVKCSHCSKKVPAEGCVLRIETLFNPTPLKLKNFAFYERESKDLDKGVVSMEDEN